jgi:DNA-binding transcriptional LysR family regulator
MERIEKVERGRIEIVAGEGFVDWLMRHSLRTFMREHPAITVDLAVASSDGIVQSVVEERAHIGMLFQPPKDERLRSHHSHPQPIETLVLSTHALTQLGRPLKLTDLLPYSCAMLHHSFGVRQHIEAAEISEGVRLPATLTTSSFNAVGQFVAAGLGYALNTRIAFPSHLDTGAFALLPMKNPLLNQGRTHVVSRHGRMLSPAVSKLLTQIVGDLDAANRC